MSTIAQKLGKNLNGKFLASCPRYLLIDPAVQEVAALYGWRADGGLRRGEVNRAQRLAVEAFARGVAAAQSDRMKEGSSGKS